jgi:hypothetical protein
MASVAIVLPSFLDEPHSGIVVFYKLLIEKLIELRHTVTIFAQVDEEMNYSTCQILPISQIYGGDQARFNFAVSPNAGLVAERLCNFRLAKVQVLTLHTDLLIDKGRSRVKSKLLSNRYKWMYRSQNIDIYLSNSRVMSTHINGILGYENESFHRVVTAPHPVKRFSSERLREPKANSGLNEFVLVLGTRSSRKRSLSLTYEWLKGNRLGLNTKGVKLLFVGPRGHQDKWIKLLRWLLRDTTVSLLSSVSDSTKFQLIKESILVIVPSRFESYSLVINEALGSHSRVVCFDDVTWAKNHVLASFIEFTSFDASGIFRLVNANHELDWAAVEDKLISIDQSFHECILELFTLGG